MAQFLLWNWLRRRNGTARKHKPEEIISKLSGAGWHVNRKRVKRIRRREGHNETLFTSRAHARFVLTVWRHDYNTARPHSKWGGKIPAEIAGERVRGHVPSHQASNMKERDSTSEW